jgi:hypothetical protein
MRAFNTVVISEFCAPFEAVEWLFLGKVPSFWPDDNAQDVRASVLALTEDYTLGSDPYSASELQAYGVNIDWEKYITLVYEGGCETKDELFNGANDHERVSHGPPRPEDCYDGHL